MEQLNIKSKIEAFFQKYKFVLLVVAVGIAFMLIPDFIPQSNTQETIEAEPERMEGMEVRLQKILTNIKGAGRVEVMLTEASGQETVYQTDTELSGDRSNHDTVIVSNADRTELGLIMQINPPIYLGAVIVCDGADDAKVRLSVTEAVSNATGLGADKISVLKMK